MKTRTRKQAYRAHLKRSHCRGKSATTCRHKNGCKRTKTSRRKSYCRSRKNHHIRI